MFFQQKAVKSKLDLICLSGITVAGVQKQTLLEDSKQAS